MYYVSFLHSERKVNVCFRAVFFLVNIIFKIYIIIYILSLCAVVFL